MLSLRICNAAISVLLAGLRCIRRNRKTQRECGKDDMEVLGLQPEWAVFMGCVEGLCMGKCLTLA